MSCLNVMSCLSKCYVMFSAGSDKAYGALLQWLVNQLDAGDLASGGAGLANVGGLCLAQAKAAVFLGSARAGSFGGSPCDTNFARGAIEGMAGSGPVCVLPLAERVAR